MGEPVAGAPIERVFEIFLQGDSATIASVSRMLECRRFMTLPSPTVPGQISVRSPFFRKPFEDGAIREFGELLCATLRTVAFALSGAEIIATCTGFRIYRNREIEKTVIWSNQIRIQGLGPNWLDPITAPDANGDRVMKKAVHAAQTSERLRLVMNLCSAQVFGWREIYDVIEAIGRDQIRSRYGMTKTAIDRIMRAANRHRHLGLTLAAGTDPATREEASTAARTIVRRFLEDEIARSLAGTKRQI